MKPNLFNYATSELSQDAFICWLLDWANDSNSEHDRNLNLLAKTFVDVLLNKKLINYNIVVDKQLKNIDILATINDRYFLVIEDKKGTSEHSNQLTKYANHAKEQSLVPRLVYFKMEEQSNWKNVQEAGFTHFNREKMLKVLNTYFVSVPEKLQNHILKDYYDELLKLDQEINSFKTLLIQNWNDKSWMGFFHNLQMELAEFEPKWNYVSNPSGGFLGFFWNDTKSSEDSPIFYLQIEQTGLVTFRFRSDNMEQDKVYRDIFKNNLQIVAEKYQIELVNYGGRGRIRDTMGVLKLNEDFIKIDNNGTIDFLGTVTFLKTITKILTDSVNKMSLSQ